MTDIHEERELFRQALLEARLRKSQQMIDADTDEVQFSKKHLRKMQQIISADRSSLQFAFYSRKKKRILALLIAAAVLIIGSITVYANKDAIVQFVQKIFGDHIEVSYANQGNVEGIPEWIEQEYTLTYVPAGYIFTNSTDEFSLVCTEWRNESGKYLRFSQSVVDGGIHGIDSEYSTSERMHIGEFDIYCTQHNSIDRTYLWSDGVYVYKIECNADFSYDELYKLINGVAPQK